MTVVPEPPLPQVTLILLEDGTALMTEDGGFAVLE